MNKKSLKHISLLNLKVRGFSRGTHLQRASGILPAVLHFGAAPASAQNNADIDIYGKWRVTREASPEGTIGARSLRQIQAVIGKVAVIDADRFVFNGSNCKHPKYMRSSDDTATYFYREWRVNSDEMPFGDRVSIVEVDCGHHVLYPVDKNRLIIADDGELHRPRSQRPKSQTKLARPLQLMVGPRVCRSYRSP